jgi:hypothetical protein
VTYLNSVVEASVLVSAGLPAFLHVLCCVKVTPMLFDTRYPILLTAWFALVPRPRHRCYNGAVRNVLLTLSFLLSPPPSIHPSATVSHGETLSRERFPQLCSSLSLCSFSPLLFPFRVLKYEYRFGTEYPVAGFFVVVFVMIYMFLCGPVVSGEGNSPPIALSFFRSR